MNSLHDIWDSVLTILKDTLTPTAMNTWFNDCVPVALDNNKFIIYTPTKFKQDILQSRYSKNITDVLSDLFSSEIQLVILAENEKEAWEEEHKKKQAAQETSGYTFENFIVGPSNKYAHAAALAVSEKPGSVYNPLFIYGNSGLGKTHLLLAIGYAIKKKNPSMNIIYVKGDDFTNALVKSIREGTTEEFRAKYRNADLLLMDDIQFIAGKEQTQEEFFHTFNALHENGRQIVVTSDRPPVEMAHLEERIRTRLEWGLMADVQSPDLETRMAITRSKANQVGMFLPDDVIEFIAKNITSNVRQIEGVVNKLTAYWNLLGDEVSLASAQKAIVDILKDGNTAPSPESIIEQTAKYYGIDSNLITGKGQQKATVLARQVSMYLCRTLIPSLSLKDIGSVFGGKDHTTVLASINKIENKLKDDKEFASSVRDITSNINAKN